MQHCNFHMMSFFLKKSQITTYNHIILEEKRKLIMIEFSSEAVINICLCLNSSGDILTDVKYISEFMIVLSEWIYIVVSEQ